MRIPFGALIVAVVAATCVVALREKNADEETLHADSGDEIKNCCACKRKYKEEKGMLWNKKVYTEKCSRGTGESTAGCPEGCSGSPPKDSTWKCYKPPGDATGCKNNEPRR
mmetsp:Transcript_21993/g.25973  ORF Transcript_21993/g.25973 Transcript_21993/m.25973 type:complete len:111 (-) Transcript_21993:1-333(-)